MLPRGLRPLVLRQARSVSLQPQPRLNSTDPELHKLRDFLSWARKSQGINRLNPPQPHPGSENAQGGTPLKKKKKAAKKAKGLNTSRPEHEKNLSSAWTREQRILKTVADIVGNEKPQGRTANGWPGENWKADSWGSDSAFPILIPRTMGRTDHNETTNRTETSLQRRSHN